MIEIIIAVIFVFALFLLLYSALSSGKAKEIKTKYRIPEGKITYTDLDKPAKALYSKRFNLAGKPDYIVKRDDGFIPIEVKDTESKTPYENHIMQLASYCLLLEDSGKKVPFGILTYRNGQFKIPFDNSLKNKVTKVLETIRGEIRNGKVERNHNQPNRCINCSLRSHCEFKFR